jgi:hypothetical protein
LVGISSPLAETRQIKSHSQEFSSLAEGNVNRPSCGSITEAILKACSTAVVRVARAIAAGVGTEADVAGGREALGIRCAQASVTAVVNRAIATTDVVCPSIAVHNADGLDANVGGGAHSGTNEGELGIGRGDPVVELLVGDQTRREASLEV